MEKTPFEIPVSDDHPLFGAYAKLARSIYHYNDFLKQAEAFHKQNPYELVAKDDEKTGDLLVHFKVNQKIPAHFGTIVGDVIHNLRAVFDYVACAAVTVNGGTITRDTLFPVRKTSESFHKASERCLKGATDQAVQIFESLQPYHGIDNKPIMDIHQLDIIDKHRLIVPVLSRLGGIDPGFSEQVRKSWEELGVTEGIPDIGQIFLNPANKAPLNDGDVVFTVKAAQRDGNEFNLKVKIEMVFGENDYESGQAIHAALNCMGDFTIRALENFRHDLFD